MKDESMTYKEICIVNTIIKYCKDRDIALDIHKLQKLLFFLCGYYKFIYGEWLLEGDFQAWPGGPVYPKAYFKVRAEFNNNYIVDRLLGDGGYDSELYKQEAFMTVMGIYTKHNDWSLSQVTHQPDTPWSNTIKEKGIGEFIDRESIFVFIKNLIDKNK